MDYLEILVGAAVILIFVLLAGACWLWIRRRGAKKDAQNYQRAAKLE